MNGIESTDSMEQVYQPFAVDTARREPPAPDLLDRGNEISRDREAFAGLAVQVAALNEEGIGAVKSTAAIARAGLAVDTFEFTTQEAALDFADVDAQATSSPVLDKPVIETARLVEKPEVTTARLERPSLMSRIKGFFTRSKVNVNAKAETESKSADSTALTNPTPPSTRMHQYTVPILEREEGVNRVIKVTKERPAAQYHNGQALFSDKFRTIMENGKRIEGDDVILADRFRAANSNDIQRYLSDKYGLKISFDGRCENSIFNRSAHRRFQDELKVSESELQLGIAELRKRARHVDYTLAS